MKMSALIEKTGAAKKAAMAQKIKDGYKTILKILEEDLQGAEMLPGAILSLKVASVVGDEFARAVKNTYAYADILKVQGKNIWRSLTSRDTIYVVGVRPDHIDEDWNEVLEILKLRVEVL